MASLLAKHLVFSVRVNSSVTDLKADFEYVDDWEILNLYVFVGLIERGVGEVPSLPYRFSTTIAPVNGVQDLMKKLCLELWSSHTDRFSL